MNRIAAGLIFGIIAGIIDVIPMIVQNLTWCANISAFSMWIVIGVLIATSNLNLPSILKGLIIAFLVLLPNAILIGWYNPLSLFPIMIMTIILSGLLGLTIDKVGKAA